jgi:hypothetical protein
MLTSLTLLHISAVPDTRLAKFTSTDPEGQTFGLKHGEYKQWQTLGNTKYEQTRTHR